VLFKFSSSLVTDAGTDFFSLIENTLIVSKWFIFFEKKWIYFNQSLV
jgi:hypothetical protein